MAISTNPFFTRPQAPTPVASATENPVDLNPLSRSITPALAPGDRIQDIDWSALMQNALGITVSAVGMHWAQTHYAGKILGPSLVRQLQFKLPLLAHALPTGLHRVGFSLLGAGAFFAVSKAYNMTFHGEQIGNAKDNFLHFLSLLGMFTFLGGVMKKAAVYLKPQLAKGFADKLNVAAKMFSVEYGAFLVWENFEMGVLPALTNWYTHGQVDWQTLKNTLTHTTTEKAMVERAALLGALKVGNKASASAQRWGQEQIVHQLLISHPTTAKALGAVGLAGAGALAFTHPVEASMMASTLLCGMARYVRTAHLTTPRLGPEFSVHRDAKERTHVHHRLPFVSLIDTLTLNTRLTRTEQFHYCHFVKDRLAPYHGLVIDFKLPAQTANLRQALEFFAKKFQNEPEMRQRLQNLGIHPADGSPTELLSYRLLDMMRRVEVDAADFLWRLGPRYTEGSGILDPHFKRMDPSRLRPKANYRLTEAAWRKAQKAYPELTKEAIQQAYEVAVEDRMLTQLTFLRRGQVPFAIMGAGQEIQGTAAAMALAHEVGTTNAAISPHYRSGALCGMWTKLQGGTEFARDSLRQMHYRATDPWSKGRQMGSHYDDPRYNILPGQSALGMNLGKAAGWAQTWKMQNRKDVVTYAEIGDATMATSDFYETLTAASTRKLPVVIGITDNGAGISVEASQSRAIRDIKRFAHGMGAEFFTADSNDFLGVYHATRQATRRAMGNQQPVVVWFQNMPRLNNHSSAAAFDFDLTQYDPLPDFGKSLEQLTILEKGSTVQRKRYTEPKDKFFDNYNLGNLGEAAKERVFKLWDQVVAEPTPEPQSVFEDSRAPFVNTVEPAPTGRPTGLMMKGAIRTALDQVLSRNPQAWLFGQDVAARGGVFQATAGLWERFPRQVVDSPINEEVIVGMAAGHALHKGAIAFPEIQFGDYAFNTGHWLYNAGMLRWTSGGQRELNMVLRTPVEPLPEGGAVYHSHSLDGLLTAVPGWVVVSPSTSRDAYVLMLSAAEYKGPVAYLEPKILLGSRLGDAIPGEPTTPETIKAMQRQVGNRGIPELDPDFRIPLGQAAIRRPGTDLTIVTWGSATVDCLKAAETLQAQGISAEVIDLRTLIPPDMQTIYTSLEKTTQNGVSRLMVVHKDKAFGGLGREIQGKVAQEWNDPSPQAPKLVSHVIGMGPSPGHPHGPPLETAIVVTPTDVVNSAKALYGNIAAETALHERRKI